MVTTPRQPLRVGHLEFAGKGFDAVLIPLSLSAGMLPRISTSGEASREGRQGVIPFVLDDQSGGFLRPGEAGAGYGNQARDKNRVYRNEGIIVHIPGITCMAYALTTQTNVVALDVSGYRALNRRVHGIMYNRRFYAFIGAQMFKDTSTSNAALTVPSTNDNITNLVLSRWDGYFNSTRYLVIGTNGQTDDVRGTTDPTANSVTWVELITHGNSTDAVWAGDYFPDLNGGWNVMIGQLNGTNGVWCVPKSEAIPVTSPTPVVDRATAAIPNPANTTVTLTSSGETVMENTNPGFTEPWTNPSNALTSNDTRATNGFTSGNETDYIGLINLGFSGVPTGSILTLFRLAVEGSESNLDDNIGKDNATIGIWTTPTKAGAPDYSFTGTEAGFGGVEWSTTDETVNFDAPARIRAQLTAAHLNSQGLYVAFKTTDSTGTSPSFQIDDMTVTATYAPPGVQVVFNQGGFTCGKLSANPTRLPYVEPEVDDLTGVTARRRLRFLDLTYDPDGDRVLGTTSSPATGINYVGHVCEFLGGVAVAGGRNETIWNQVKIVDDSGQTRDLGFPGLNGSKAQTIIWMRAQGSQLLVQVADTDGADSQTWIYWDGKWNAYSPLQSKSSAITVEPLLWAESTLGDYQGIAYNFLSLSTNTGASRVFVPSDLLADPHLHNTSQVKHDGPLYVQTLELDIGGAVESQKALMRVQALSRRLDADVSYGDVRMLVDTGGDPTIAAAEVDVTFNSAFESANIVTGTDPGIAIQTGIIRLIHDHQASSVESPQALPIGFELVGGWPYQEVVGCFLSPNQDLLHLYNQWKDLIATKRAYRFLGGGWNEPAVITKFDFKYKPSQGIQQPTEKDIEGAYCEFLFTPGATA